MAIQAPSYPNNIGFPQTSQDWITDNGCAAAGFPPSCFNPQHKHQNVFLDPSLLVSTSKSNNDFNVNYLPSLPNSQSLALQFENQSHEIDHCIKLQSEKLRIKLQEQRKQQVTILRNMELDMLCLMRQKDEEIGRATKKKMELEDLLNRLQAENQAWRRAAVESGALILSLNNSLERMREKAQWRFNNVLADDAQSCCEENGKEDEQQIMRACKSCNAGRACFLFLPCRHLCSCKACEPFLQACPVCTMPKKATIEALIL